MTRFHDIPNDASASCGASGDPTHEASSTVVARTRTAGGVVLASALLLVAVAGLVWSEVLSAVGIHLDAALESRVLVLVHAAGAATAAVLLARAAQTATGRIRLAWRLVAVGCALLALGDLVWLATAWFDPGRATETHWYATLTPGMFAVVGGLLVVPSASDHVSGRIRRLDVLIVAVATFTVFWARPAQAIVRQFGDAVRAVSAGHTSVLDGSALVGLAVVLAATTTLARCRPGRGSPIRTAAAALLAVGVGELILTTDPLDRSDVATLSGALPLVSVALLVASARRLRATPTADPDGASGADSSTTRTFALSVALPEMATLVAIAAVAMRQFATPTMNITGLVLGTVVVALSIVRLGRLEYEQRQLTRSLRNSAERLFHEARVDSLTGLGNRLALDEDLNELLVRLTRTGDRRGLAVFCLDVDHFKHINDALGHHVGDALLVEVAERLRVVFGEKVYRVGGDEFVALREHCGLQAAEETAAAAVLEVRRPVVIDGEDLATSASIGLAHHDVTVRGGEPGYTPVAERADTLLRRADLALYRAKELGRDRWAGYAPMLQERADHHLAVQEALSRAVDEGQMDMWLQPVAELATGEIVGARARLRWHSPDFGLLAPDEFLHDAIQGGMLKSLDSMLFRSIAQLLPHLVEETGLQWISTTLSRQEIVHPGLVGLVGSAIGDGHDRLRIEVSEDTIVDDTARKNVEALAALGVHLTVARFGTGPSSMLSLGRYPASTIKIDPSFTAGIGRRHEDTVIVASVAGLGEDLGLELAADGIDEAFQSRMLVELGFTLGEGRLIGEALPATEFLARGIGHRRVGDEQSSAELAGRSGA